MAGALDFDFPDVRSSAIETIGRTPLVALERLSAGLPGLVVAKLESFSPGASIKDRIARRMIEDAERDGLLRPGGAIVEATSGNTGIGLAVTAAVCGYRFYAVLSEGNSVERRRALAALGAEVVLVPQANGSAPGEVSGADLLLVEARADQLARELNAFRPDQFANSGNVAAHEETTGPEIWEQTGGRVDAFVAAVGTGGTFLGVAAALKARSAAIRCIAAEPAGVRTLAGSEVLDVRHKIQGAGYNRIPPLWEGTLCDGYIGVTDRDAIETARALASREGILGGFSTGANVWGALEIARNSPEGTVVATVCPDTGLKYLSTDLYP